MKKPVSLVLALILALVAALSLSMMAFANNEEMPVITIKGYTVTGIEGTDIQSCFMDENNVVVEPSQAKQLVLKSKTTSFSVNGIVIEHKGKSASAVFPLPVDYIEETTTVTTTEPSIIITPLIEEKVEKVEETTEATTEKTTETTTVVEETTAVEETTVEETTKPETITETTTVVPEPTTTIIIPEEEEIPTKVEQVEKIKETTTIVVPEVEVDITLPVIDIDTERAGNIISTLIVKGTEFVEGLKADNNEDEVNDTIIEEPTIEEYPTDIPNTGDSGALIPALIALVSSATTAGGMLLKKKP